MSLPPPISAARPSKAEKVSVMGGNADSYMDWTRCCALVEHPSLWTEDLINPGMRSDLQIRRLSLTGGAGVKCQRQKDNGITQKLVK